MISSSRPRSGLPSTRPTSGAHSGDHQERWPRLDPADWTPRELRHSFVSVLSDSGVSLNDIADLCGQSGTTVTEKVYRHQL
jgi:integrase